MNLEGYTRFTDSAAAATAMSTGVKTYQGAIGVDLDQQPLRHLTETAKELGKATGIVTSVPFSHATPAGDFAALTRGPAPRRLFGLACSASTLQYGRAGGAEQQLERDLGCCDSGS